MCLYPKFVEFVLVRAGSSIIRDVFGSESKYSLG
jgi:hypothetical protein